MMVRFGEVWLPAAPGQAKAWTAFAAMQQNVGADAHSLELPMILLRTTRIDTGTRQLAADLGAASGDTVAMLVDERRGLQDAGGLPKVSVTDEACEGLGLYRPADYGWRCGDYGFYLARRQYPAATHFWMIDYDVRIGGDAPAFFAACAARPELDLLAAHVRATGRDWWWCASVASADAEPRRCFFPVVRLSARAADVLLAKRREHGRRPLRRLLWPNDEAFVATAVEAAGLSFADFNALGQTFYDDTTFTYTEVIDGDGFAGGEGPPRLYHPVLSGEDLARKRRKLVEDHGKPTPRWERAYRRAAAAVNGATRW